MQNYVTSHAIIKALKGPEDPPAYGAPSKIEIARRTWDTTSIHFPNKEEVLTEWILSAFIKSVKDDLSPSPTGLVLSAPHWSLLSDILSSPSQESRQSKVWLSALLSRISISSIITIFFKCATYVDLSQKEGLIEPFIFCVQILWPLSAVRMNLDALTDCLGSILAYLAYDMTQLNTLSSPCLLVVRSFRQTVGNVTSKKKAFSWFMEQSFLHWVRLACPETSIPIYFNRESKVLISEIYQAGIDVFFCLDALKSPNDPLEAILTDSRYSLENMQNSQYQIVPLLYKSYIQELRRHRSTIFASGSSQAQEYTTQNKWRDAGMRVFATCCGALRACGDVLEVWKSVLELVQVLEEANLVGHRLAEENDVLNEITASTVKALAEHEDSQFERSEAALQILCILSRIDYDLVNPFLPDILLNLSTINPSVCPLTEVLLRTIIDFHTKTRTMPCYLMHILQALSNLKISSQYSTVPLAHRCCTSGALLSVPHLEELSRSIRGFLTPGQTQQVVDTSLAMLSASWMNYSKRDSMERDAMDINATKDGAKQRSSLPNVSVPSTKEHAALQYSLVARAVATLLQSLPFPSLSGSVYASVQRSISDAWTGTLVKAAQTAFTPVISLDKNWAAQSVSSASLRVRHALSACPALRSLDVSKPSIATTKDICAFIRSPETIPEFVVELIRSFFDVDFRSSSPAERDTLNKHLISYLKTNLASRETGQNDPSYEMFWNGSTSSLNPLEASGHERGALVVLHLLLDRWLPLFDEIASQEHLKDISEFLLSKMVSHAVDRPGTGQLSLDCVLERALHSALFWELPDLRGAMVSTMDASTRCTSWEDFEMLLKQVRDTRTSSSSRHAWTTNQVKSVLATFITLLRAPREYLPRNLRPTYVRRAIVADTVMALSVHENARLPRSLAQRTRSVVRAWLVSMSDAFDITDVVSDNLQEYTEYLIHPTNEDDVNDDAFSAKTLALVSSIFRQAIRSAMRGEGARLSTTLRALLREPHSTRTDQVHLQFTEILVAECPAADKLSPLCIEAIRELHSDLHARYSDALLTMSTLMHAVTGEQAFRVRSWRMCLILRKWLNALEATAGIFGSQLLRKIATEKVDEALRDRSVKEYYTEVFLLLLGELDVVSAEKRNPHLELIISGYILLNGRSEVANQAVCDAALGRTAKSMPTDAFVHVLSLLREALRKGLTNSGETRSVVHLSNILLEDAPEGTMRVVQEHFEECLHIFVDDPIFVTGNAKLSLEVLSFIGRVCSDKPAYLRRLVLGPIWLLLAKLLMGAETHAQESHTDILHGITSTAGSLLRLRRDLVTSTLPHLGMVLSSLIRALRAPRAQLGARQRSQVSDTLPWWISPSAPLGVSEARSVARLLTSLRTKTIPRTFTSRSKEKDKERTAESLLGAFSKHAGPVLGAYINALVDPLVVIDASVREALAPGLYTLCETMGEHGRDALMASGCDAAGRTVLKALWKEYDKQRYVGRG